MKHTNLSQKTASLVISIFLTAFAGLSALCQTERSSNVRELNVYTREQASIFNGIQESEYSGLAVTGYDNQTKSVVRQATASRFLFDIQNSRLNNKGTTVEELVRKDRLVQKYGIETGLDLYNGNICLGMTREMIYESLGEPSEVLVHDVGTSAWVEWDYTFYGIYLCFDGGILSGIQQY